MLRNVNFNKEIPSLKKKNETANFNIKVLTSHFTKSLALQLKKEMVTECNH